MTKEQFEIAVKAIMEETSKILAEAKTEKEKINAIMAQNMQLNALVKQFEK